VGRSKKQGGETLRIAVDMDEVIADSLGKQLRIFREETGVDLDAERMLRYGFHGAIPERYRSIFDAIPHRPGFMADLDLIEGSRPALEELASRHQVWITSAAMEVPTSFEDKFKWLQRHFPFIPTSRIVFCGDKGIIFADYLVDDRSRHFRDFCGVGILFSAPHNLREDAPLRANSWAEVKEILAQHEAETVQS
jgi:5'-nucleotidase